MIFCPSRRIFHSRNSRIIYNPYFRNRMLMTMNRRLHIYNQIGSFTFRICITMKTCSQGSSQLSGNNRTTELCNIPEQPLLLYEKNENDSLNQDLPHFLIP